MHTSRNCTLNFKLHLFWVGDKTNQHSTVCCAAQPGYGLEILNAGVPPTAPETGFHYVIHAGLELKAAFKLVNLLTSTCVPKCWNYRHASSCPV
jgi:hypothetical protein